MDDGAINEGEDTAGPNKRAWSQSMGQMTYQLSGKETPAHLHGSSEMKLTPIAITISPTDASNPRELLTRP